MHSSALALVAGTSGALAPTVPAQSGLTATVGIGVWQGGRTALVVNAGAYDGTTMYLEMLGPDAATWVAISAKLTANGVTSYDLPSGVYRMHVGSSSSALYATLVRIPYG